MRTRGEAFIERALALAILTVLAACGPLAASAPASVTVERVGGIKYLTKSFELQPGTPRTVRVACPARHHVLGGGHYNSGQYGDVIASHSYPFDSDDRRRKPDDGWAAQLRGFSQSYPATVHAICVKILPEYRSYPDTVSPGGEGATGRSCTPASLEPVAGGTSGPAALRELRSYPTVDKGQLIWYTGFWNHASQALEGTRFIVCAGLDTTYVGAGGTATPQTQATEDVQCPPDKPRMVGGGVSIGGVTAYQFNTAIAASRPAFSNGGWQAWVDNYNTGAVDVPFSVYAVCVASL